MKKLLTVIALSTLIAAPALAANTKHHARERVHVTQEDPLYNVYVNGEYRGHDRDSRVRIELERDTTIGSGN